MCIYKDIILKFAKAKINNNGDVVKNIKTIKVCGLGLKTVESVVHYEGSSTFART